MLKNYRLMLNEEMFYYDAPLVEHPDDVLDLCQSLQLNISNVERLYAFFLNSKARVTGFEECAVGALNVNDIQPRQIFSAALMCNASAIIVAHNHPSGDPTPSDTDIKTTEKLVKAGEILHVPIIDHIIVGGYKYYSFKEHDRI